MVVPAGCGAIGPHGSVTDTDTELPNALRFFELPEPPTGDEVRDAVRASLDILNVAPDYVVVPVLAAVYRSVLGACDFSLHLTGQTGTFKTELAALAQQHFGAGFDARNLPGSWSSTGNAMEALAFAAKDALLVVDDFAPSGTANDVARLHREADRVLRAQGNRSGRARLRPDGSLRPVKRPRGVVLSTGEDTPRGQSLRARVAVIEIGDGQVNVGALTQAQATARAGLYASAVSAYLRWLAGQLDQVRRGLAIRAVELRDKAAQSMSHLRTPTTIAQMTVGWEYFLRFARDVGALTDEGVTGLSRRVWLALGQMAECQRAFISCGDPVRRFLELLRSAITSGRAHLASPDGEPPEPPGGLGWRHREIGSGPHTRDEWQPQGDRVGWIDDDGIFLDPAGAYRSAQAMVGASGDGITLGESTLWRRLNEQGVLATTDNTRQTLKVRRTFEHQRRSVLHMRLSALFDSETPTGPPTNATTRPKSGSDSRCWSGLWSGSWSGFGTPAGQTRPPEPAENRPDGTETAVPGSPGRVGRVSGGG